MSMGVCLALGTLYYTYRLVGQEAAVDSLFTAAIFGSLYWITGLSAILYPGSKGMDLEFGEGFPQFWLLWPCWDLRGLSGGWRRLGWLEGL